MNRHSAATRHRVATREGSQGATYLGFTNLEKERRPETQMLYYEREL